MRIVAFVGSPVAVDEKELIKLAKRLKKEKVNVDLINFGEEGKNTEKLTAFINTLNGKDGTGSHLVTVPPGPHLSGKLIVMISRFIDYRLRPHGSFLSIPI